MAERPRFSATLLLNPPKSVTVMVLIPFLPGPQLLRAGQREIRVDT